MTKKVLLLLNARREWFAPGEAATEAVATIRRALSYAREQCWSIVHAHDVNKAATVRGAIEGLEPHSGEPLIVLTRQNALALLSEEAFAGARLYLAGAVFSRAGLATALAAPDFGCKIAFIEDAVLPCAEAVSVRPKMIPPVIWPVRSSVLFGADSAIVNFVDLRAREPR